MKFSLLPLLFLALPAVAQYRPMYSTPRPSSTPSYTPRPTTSSTSNYNYQRQSAQIQQAHQNFQQMQAQQRQQMQDQYYYRHQQLPLLGHAQSAEQLAQAQARQQQAEQQATAQLAHLAEEQQRQRQAHPAADAQQAEAQQKADAQQLARLSLRNYREVFLPGQMLGAWQSLVLAPPARQQLQAINRDLLDNAWWHQQDATQLQTKLASHGTALTKLFTDLLGSGSAALPPTVRPARALQEQLSQGPTFDQAAAAQLLREAAQTQKQLAGAQLALSVQRFSELSTRLATNPATSLPAQKQQRKEVKKSLKRVNKELVRYSARVGADGPLRQAQTAILNSTASYLAQNGK